MNTRLGCWIAAWELAAHLVIPIILATLMMSFPAKILIRWLVMRCLRLQSGGIDIVGVRGRFRGYASVGPGTRIDSAVIAVGLFQAHLVLDPGAVQH